MRKDWTEPDYAAPHLVFAKRQVVEHTCECGYTGRHYIAILNIPAQVECRNCFKVDVVDKINR